MRGGQVVCWCLVLLVAFSLECRAEFSLAGLSPGLSLEEVSRRTELNQVAGVSCLRDSAQAYEMVSAPLGYFEQEAEVGVLSCMLIEQRTVGNSALRPATTKLAGVRSQIWLSFVEKDARLILAMIVAQPLKPVDAKLMEGAMESIFGQPTMATRNYLTNITMPDADQVASWPVNNDTLDVTSGGTLYFFRPDLTLELAARLKTLIGRSFLFNIPIDINH